MRRRTDEEERREWELGENTGRRYGDGVLTAFSHRVGLEFIRQSK